MTKTTKTTKTTKKRKNGSSSFRCTESDFFHKFGIKTLTVSLLLLVIISLRFIKENTMLQKLLELEKSNGMKESVITQTVVTTTKTMTSQNKVDADTNAHEQQQIIEERNLTSNVANVYSKASTTAGNRSSTAVSATTAPSLSTKAKMNKQQQNGKPEPKQQQIIKDWPVIVFHLGPVKTGSTTLQAALNADIEVLKKDNFELPGGKNFYSLIGKINCFRSADTSCANDKDYKEFTNEVHRILKNNKSVILTQENWPEMIDESNEEHWKYFYETIFKGYNTKFVITYRRYFEWLTSFHYQEMRIPPFGPGKHYKHMPGKKNNNIVGRHIPGIAQYADWIQQTQQIKEQNKSQEQTQQAQEMNHPSFQMIRRHDLYFNELKHPSQIIFERYVKHFKTINKHPKVEILKLNMHENPNIIRQFYCRTLKGLLPNSCQYRINNIPKLANPTISHNYDMLTTQAYEQGLINKTLLNQAPSAREYISNAIRNRQENELKLNSNDFPLICMSTKQQNILLNTSLLYEKQFVPHWYSSIKGESEHRAKFEEAIKKKKFCNIDAKKVLSSTPNAVNVNSRGWINFLKKLHYIKTIVRKPLKVVRPRY